MKNRDSEDMPGLADELPFRKKPLRARISVVVGVAVAVIAAAIVQRFVVAEQVRQRESVVYRELISPDTLQSEIARGHASRLEQIADEYWDWRERLEREHDGFDQPRIKFNMRVLLMPNDAVFEHDRRGRAMELDVPLGEADFAEHVEAALEGIEWLERTGAFALVDDIRASNVGLYADPAEARDFMVEFNGGMNEGVGILRDLVWAAAGMQYVAAGAGDWDSFWEQDARVRTCAPLPVEHWPCLLTWLITSSCRSAHQSMLMQLIAERALPRDVCERLLALSNEDSAPQIELGMRGEQALVSLYLSEAAVGRADPNILLPILTNPLRAIPKWDAIVERAESLALAETWSDDEGSSLIALRDELDSARGFLRIIVPAMGRIVINARLSEAEREAMRTAIAIEMHRIDVGSFPATLEDLVPSYLRAVPTDPFSEESLRYRVVDDGESFTLYSVGLDGIDDLGEHASSALRPSNPSLDHRFFPPPAYDVEP